MNFCSHERPKQSVSAYVSITETAEYIDVMTIFEVHF